MDRWVAFFLGVPLGIVILVYRTQIKEFVGSIAWAEQKLGSGGTYTLLAIIGVMVSVLSLMYALGTLQGLFVTYFGRFFL